MYLPLLATPTTTATIRPTVHVPISLLINQCLQPSVRVLNSLLLANAATTTYIFPTMHVQISLLILPQSALTLLLALLSGMLLAYLRPRAIQMETTWDE